MTTVNDGPETIPQSGSKKFGDVNDANNTHYKALKHFDVVDAVNDKERALMSAFKGLADTVGSTGTDVDAQKYALNKLVEARDAALRAARTNVNA